MTEQKLDGPLSKIQYETIKQIAEGFNKVDSTGKLHVQVADSIERNIAVAKDPVVRILGVNLLGAYLNGEPQERFHDPILLEKLCGKIASIGANDSDLGVKTEALYQVSEILEKPDEYNKMHGPAVQAIKKVAASVTVTEQDSPEARLVKQALDKLIAYASGKIASDRKLHWMGGYECVPVVQSEALDVIDFLTATTDVEKFEQLKP